MNARKLFSAVLMAMSLSGCAVGLYAPGAPAVPKTDPLAGPDLGDASKAGQRVGAGVVVVDTQIPVQLATPINSELPGRAIFVVTEDIKAAGNPSVTVLPAGSRAVGLYVPLKQYNTRLDICIDGFVSPTGKPLARLKANSRYTCLAQIHSDTGAGLSGAVSDRGPMLAPVIMIPKDTPASLVLWDDLRFE